MISATHEQMEMNLKIGILLFGILCTGMTSGLCFTWGNAVTPGIGRLNDLTFLQSFQAMNRVIINGKFLLIFFSPALLLFVNAYLHKGDGLTFLIFMAAALLFFVGIGLVTIFGNVPLNEMLDGQSLEMLSSSELREVRERFEQPWNQFHHVRTITATLSFILLLIGLVISK
jgi:uncharacterized membrane protein